MSDNWLRLIATDRWWQPDEDAAAAAVVSVKALLPEADSVESRSYDEVTFIDQGANFERVFCPICVASQDLDWWCAEMDRAAGLAFTELDVVLPCCGARVTLNDLDYDWPAGFASFELAVLNPGRDHLADDELAGVSAILGYPLKQVMAHY